MNIQHSSRTDQWFTPNNILDLVKIVLGEIDLDPASSDLANKNVNAKNIITEEQDALITTWLSGSLFLNPPGGKIKNKSKTALFWKKLMEHREGGKLTHGIFLAFSLEALQSTQGKGCRSIGDFTFCVPKNRISFNHPDGTPGPAPSHSNMIVYVPGTINKTELFIKTFKDLGVIIHEGKYNNL